MPDRGAWDPAAGVFPANPSFGDTWTATTSGTVNGLAIVAGQTITFNRLADANSAAAWDLDQGKRFSLYPSDVYEDPLSVALTYAAGGQVRTTAPGGGRDRDRDKRCRFYRATIPLPTMRSRNDSA